MTNHYHTVVSNESLWKLADRYYQNPTLWPLLFAYNNRPETFQKTGIKILDPDLIYIGQKLVIPEKDKLQGDPEAIKHKISKRRLEHTKKNGHNHTQLQRIRQAQPQPKGGTEPMGRAAAKPMAHPGYEFDLGESKLADIRGKGFTLSIKLTGKLLVQNTQSIDALTLKDLKQVEFKSKQEAETIAGKLIQNTKINFDPSKKTLNFSCGLTTQSNMPNSPEVSLEAGVNARGQPTLKGSSTHQLVKGKIQQFAFASEEIGVEFEIAVETDTTSERFDWGTIGATMVIAGAVIFFGLNLVENVVTLGLGTADDAICFAIIGAMLGFASQLRSKQAKPNPALGVKTANPIAANEKPITADSV